MPARKKTSPSFFRRLQERLGLAEFRTILALAMVVVAVLGAIAADRGAQGDFASAADERRLDQGQMLEIQYRQSLLDLGNKGAEFERRRDELDGDGKRALATAKQLRLSGSPDDLRAAAALELQGQEYLLRERLYTAFEGVLADTRAGDSNVAWEDALSRSVARKLQRVGFDVKWTGAGLAAGSEAPAQRPSIWKAEMDGMLKGHAEGPGLAWDVFVFVLALFFLVLADLSIKRATLALSFATAGILIGVGCAVLFALQPSTGVWTRSVMLGLPVGSILLGVGAWWFGLLRWLGAPRQAKKVEHNLEPPHPEIVGFAGAHMTAREADDLVSKGIVVLLSLTVLLSAFAGYNYSSASARTNEASLDGFTQQVEMIKRSTRPTAEALNEFDAMAEVLDRRIECAALKQRIDLLNDEQIEADGAELSAREDAACSPASAPIYAVAAKGLDGPAGIDADPFFPDRYYSERVNGEADNATVAFARWDGDTQVALFWGSKATSFLTILTLCAIALFLLGQGLGIGPSRLTMLLVATALAFDLYAVWLTVDTARRSSDELTSAIPPECQLPADLHLPNTPVEVAAHFFAQGKLMTDNAYTGSDYAKASAALACTVKARPKFALGLYYYATALSEAGSAQADQYYSSTANPLTLKEVVSDRKATIDSMEDYGYTAPSSLFNSYGAALWHYAVLRGNREALQQSIAAYQKAIEVAKREAEEDPRASAPGQQLSGSDLLPYLNLGLSYLTQLQFDKARQWYADALKYGADKSWDLITTSLTTFEVLSANCHHLYSDQDCARLNGEIERDKAALISGGFTPTGSGDGATIADPAGYVSADTIDWGFRLVGFDPAKDKLAIAWYVSDAAPSGLTSSGAPQWTFGQWRALPRLGGHIDVTRMSQPDDSGMRYFQEKHLHRNNNISCLAGGKYRAEFYVNGAKVLTHEFPMRFHDFDVTRWHQLGIAFCRPAEWRPWQGPSSDRSGLDLVQGLVTKDGKPAVFAFTFFSPAELPGDLSRGQYFQDRALRYLKVARVLAAGSSEPVGMESACARGTHAGGFISSIWSTPEGWIHVALVLGDSLPPDQACDVALSIDQL